MIRKQKRSFWEISGWWIGFVSLVIAIPGVLLYFLPASAQKESTQQNMTVGPVGAAVMNNGNNAVITVNPVKPELPVFKQPKPVLGELDYRDLASPALSGNLIGKNVLFRAIYLSDWDQTQSYAMYGVSVSNVTFINHRSVYYDLTVSAVGIADLAFPPFPISIPPTELYTVRKFKRGDVILISGTVEQPKDGPGIIAGFTPDFAHIYVRATNVQLLQSD